MYGLLMVFVNVSQDVLSARNAQACAMKSTPPVVEYYSVPIKGQLPYIGTVLSNMATRL